jgi:hypothetical protein
VTFGGWERPQPREWGSGGRRFESSRPDNGKADITRSYVGLSLFPPHYLSPRYQERYHGSGHPQLRELQQPQQRERRKAWRTGSRQGTASATAKAERQAAAAVETAVAVENAWATITDALQLFTAAGELNTRARAEGIIAAALPLLDDPVWAKTRRVLTRPQLLTFLDRTHEQRAALPVTPAVRDAAVRAEGLRQRPQGLRGASLSASALRGVLLATGLVLSLSGPEGTVAVTQVRRVLRQAWRASSLVECLNSVARMQQSRHRRMTCGLLALKRLYGNCRTFRTGRRRGQTP